MATRDAGHLTTFSKQLRDEEQASKNVKRMHF